MTDEEIRVYCRFIYDMLEAQRRAWMEEPMWVEEGGIYNGYQTMHHPDGSSVRQQLFVAGGGGSKSSSAGGLSFGGGGGGSKSSSAGGLSFGGGGGGMGNPPMNGGPAAKSIYETTPTPMLPPRPEPKPPTKGTPCYYCGVQAFVWRHGVPQCAAGHARTSKKST